MARYTGQTRTHTESDLRAFLSWCTQRGLDPLTAHRVHVELYVRWMQETRRYKPATISRRLSVVIGFYRTCVIDGVLTSSPPSTCDAPTSHPNHRRWPIAPAFRSEACGADIEDLREEHGHHVLKVRGKGAKVVLTPLPPAVQRAIERAIDQRSSGPILRNRRGLGIDRHAATRRLKQLADDAGISLPRMHPRMLRYTFVTTCSTPVSTCATSTSPPTWPPAPDKRSHLPHGRRLRSSDYAAGRASASRQESASAVPLSAPG